MKHVTTVPVSRQRDTTCFTADLPGAASGNLLLLVIMEAGEYPLTEHCRFVRLTDPASPNTYTNTVYHHEAPGLRVGPWPGWKDIPAMPAVFMNCGEQRIRGRYEFRGDEFESLELRCSFPVTEGSRCHITIEVEDKRLAPVSMEIYAGEKNPIAPIPVSLLPELENEYPRLLFKRGDIHRLRQKTGNSHAVLWRGIETLLKNRRLAPRHTAESKALPGPERLFPQDRLLLSAIVALVEPSPENIHVAREELFSLVELTRDHEYQPLRIDTQCGELLFTLCLGYDWLYEFLDREERESVRAGLFKTGNICWAHLGYDRTDYAQAHYLGCALGLISLSFLFPDSHPRASEWMSYFRAVLDRVLHMLPADGFYPHGINLWIYEHGFLLRWLELYRVCAGEDLWNRPCLRQISRFRIAAASPGGLLGVTFGDPQFRVGGDAWIHDLAAARLDNPDAQWMANRTRDLPHAGVDIRSVAARRKVYEFLFFDSSIVTKAPQEEVTTFDDGGQLFVRGAGSVVTFRSGPPLGRRRFERGEHGGYGHSDPCNSSFMLCSGDELVICGPGPVYRRDTALQNVITIDGRGQVGDGTVWLPDIYPPRFHGRIPSITRTGEKVICTVDLTNCYLPFLGVTSYTRELTISLSGEVTGTDIVTLRSEKDIQWNLHTWGVFVPGETAGEQWVIEGLSERWSVSAESPPGTVWKTGPSLYVPAYPNDGRKDMFLKGTVRGTRATFKWAIRRAKGKE